MSTSNVAAPVANASCKPGNTCWGALAVSLSTGSSEIVTNAGSLQKAEDDAVLECNVAGATNDCQVIRSGQDCFWLAKSSDGTTYYGRIGPTQDAADADALGSAGPGGTMIMHDCNAPW